MNWTIGGLLIFTATFLTGYGIWRIIYWVFMKSKYKKYLNQEDSEKIWFLDFIEKFYGIDAFIKVTSWKPFRFMHTDVMYKIVNIIIVVINITLGVALFILYFKINATDFGLYFDIPL